MKARTPQDPGLFLFGIPHEPHVFLPSKTSSTLTILRLGPEVPIDSAGVTELLRSFSMYSKDNGLNPGS